MNHTSARPLMTDTGPAPFNADQRRRVWVATLLTAAVPAAVAVAALTTAPLAATGAPTAPHPSTTLIADCNVPIQHSALNTMKWPACAGD